MKQEATTDRLDKIDYAILAILQENGRIPNVELAKQIHLSPPATHLRVKRLEEAGYLEKYVGIVNRERLGLDLLCFIHVSLKMHRQENLEAFLKAMQEMPEVLECYHVTGQYDILLKAALVNRMALERFVVEKLPQIPGVERVYTSLALKELKSTTAYPVPP